MKGKNTFGIKKGMHVYNVFLHFFFPLGKDVCFSRENSLWLQIVSFLIVFLVQFF